MHCRKNTIVVLMYTVAVDKERADQAVLYFYGRKFCCMHNEPVNQPSILLQNYNKTEK